MQTSPKPPRLAQPLDSSSAGKLTPAQIISVLETPGSFELQGEGWGAGVNSYSVVVGLSEPRFSPLRMLV